MKTQSDNLGSHSNGLESKNTETHPLNHDINVRKPTSTTELKEYIDDHVQSIHTTSTKKHIKPTNSLHHTDSFKTDQTNQTQQPSTKTQKKVRFADTKEDNLELKENNVDEIPVAPVDFNRENAVEGFDMNTYFSENDFLNFRISEEKIDMQEFRMSTFQRVYATFSKWMSPGVKQFLLGRKEIISKKNDSVYIPEYEEITLDVQPRKSTEMKVPSSRRRKANQSKKVMNDVKSNPIETIDSTPETSDIETKIREQEVEEEDFTHLSMNSANYRRFELSWNKIQVNMRQIHDNFHLERYISLNELSVQVRRLVERMDHSQASDCVDSEDWLIISILLVWNLICERVVYVDNVKEIESQVVTYLSKMGFNSVHVNLVMRISNLGD